MYVVHEPVTARAELHSGQSKDVRARAGGRILREPPLRCRPCGRSPSSVGRLTRFFFLPCRRRQTLREPTLGGAGTAAPRAFRHEPPGILPSGAAPSGDGQVKAAAAPATRPTTGTLSAPAPALAPRGRGRPRVLERRLLDAARAGVERFGGPRAPLGAACLPGPLRRSGRAGRRGRRLRGRRLGVAMDRRRGHGTLKPAPAPALPPATAGFAVHHHSRRRSATTTTTTTTATKTSPPSLRAAVVPLRAAAISTFLRRGTCCLRARWRWELAVSGDPRGC